MIVLKDSYPLFEILSPFLEHNDCQVKTHLPTKNKIKIAAQLCGRIFDQYMKETQQGGIFVLYKSNDSGYFSWCFT